MTRLRYTKDKTNPALLISTKDILFANGRTVSIVLNTTTLAYNFVDNEMKLVISSGASKTLIALKKLVRDSLLQSGVSLTKEVKIWSKNKEVAA